LLEVPSTNVVSVRPVGAALIHADGRTDEQASRHDRVNCRFCDLAHAP